MSQRHRRARKVTEELQIILQTKQISGGEQKALLEMVRKIAAAINDRYDCYIVDVMIERMNDLVPTDLSIDSNEEEVEEEKGTMMMSTVTTMIFQNNVCPKH